VANTRFIMVGTVTWRPYISVMVRVAFVAVPIVGFGADVSVTVVVVLAVVVTVSCWQPIVFTSMQPSARIEIASVNLGFMFRRLLPCVFNVRSVK